MPITKDLLTRYTTGSNGERLADIVLTPRLNTQTLTADILRLLLLEHLRTSKLFFILNEFEKSFRRWL